MIFILSKYYCFTNAICHQIRYFINNMQPYLLYWNRFLSFVSIRTRIGISMLSLSLSLVWYSLQVGECHPCVCVCGFEWLMGCAFQRMLARNRQFPPWPASPNPPTFSSQQQHKQLQRTQKLRLPKIFVVNGTFWFSFACKFMLISFLFLHIGISVILFLLLLITFWVTKKKYRVEKRERGRQEELKIGNKSKIIRVKGNLGKQTTLFWKHPTSSLLSSSSRATASNCQLRTFPFPIRPRLSIFLPYPKIALKTRHSPWRITLLFV